MTDRDRLIYKIMSLKKPTISLQTAMDIADALIDESVIVPPCKVVYYIAWEGAQFAFAAKKSIDLLKIYELKNLKKYGYYLTKEEAEGKLKECEGK